MQTATRAGTLSRWATLSDVASGAGYFSLWLAVLAFVFGIIAMVSGQVWLLPTFIALGYAAIIIASIRSVQSWRDSFNPLTLICVIAFVRHLLPAILLLNGVELPDEVRKFFQVMKLSDDDWRWAHVLALTGLLSAVVGWYLVQPFGLKNGRMSLNFRLQPGVKHAALLGMAVGFAALAVFLASNASLGVISSGAFRGTTIQAGTGKYFFLAYFLIAGSVLLCCHYLASGRPAFALVPVLSATLFYWVLGGRGRAIVSLAAGLLLLWYLYREKDGWPKISLNYPYIIILPLIILAVVGVSYLGALYRGELGARAFSEGLSVRGLWEYLQGAIFTDLGQLHALAGAIAVGPGVLGGQTFLGSLSWPLNKFIFIPGRSSGVYIVETLVGFVTDDDKWAVNASLIGDAYVNLGLRGVPVVMMLYGAIVKLLYLKFRQGRIHAGIYVIAFICSLQMSWASIEVWPQTLTLLVFTWGLILVGETLFKIRRSRL
ncbi:MAG TPA: O-antigen polymerase [Candidatus Binatia bacterium]|nr:O-antigen polymerase [Candidatus Binatia bacterium]